jgi:hypothetical protein
VPDPAAAGIEFLTHASTMSFVQRAKHLGVPVHLEDYMYGTHSFAYWARDLRQYLVPLMQTFAHPSPPPPTTAYQSINRSWSQWGWEVTLQRPEAQQFSSLTHAQAAGFTLHGTGTATVVTPAFYGPGSVATVTFSGASGPVARQVRADNAGRLHVLVPLGGAVVPAAVGSTAVIGVPGIPSWGGSTTVTIAAA